MPTDPRINVNVRIGTAGVKIADQLAAEAELSRSDVLRAALYVALQHQRDLRQRLAVIKEALDG